MTSTDTASVSAKLIEVCFAMSYEEDLFILIPVHAFSQVLSGNPVSRG